MNIREQLSKQTFLRSSKIAGFSPLLRSREVEGAIFSLYKKRGFESSSDVSFPSKESESFYTSLFHYDWLV